jgi:hypothetical protein
LGVGIGELFAGYAEGGEQLLGLPGGSLSPISNREMACFVSPDRLASAFGWGAGFFLGGIIALALAF